MSESMYANGLSDFSGGLVKEEPKECLVTGLWAMAPVELIGFYKFHKKGDFYCKLPF